MHIGCSDISDITMGNEKSNHQFLHKKISLIMIAKQASAWHLWVFLSTNFLFRRLPKEGRKIGKLERTMFQDFSTPHAKRYFVNLSWVIPCCEQKLGIGAQAMCIACNDTSVIVINFRKSKTHAITDTYCIYIYIRPFFFYLLMVYRSAW